MTNGGASAFASDSPRDDEDDGAAPLPESPGTPPSSARRAGHPFFNSLLENEVRDKCSTCSCPDGSLVYVRRPVSAHAYMISATTLVAARSLVVARQP